MNTALTTYRRFVLARLAEGPKTLNETCDGHPNIMPSLIIKGLAEYWTDGLYQITEAGREALNQKDE